MWACMLSRVQLFVTPRTVAHQAPLSREFSRQEYWSGLPFPSLVDLPDLGIEPMSLISPSLGGRFSTSSATWKAPGKSINVSKYLKVINLTCKYLKLCASLLL